MKMRTSIDTGGAKMEILSSGNPILGEGSYILIQPDADAMILVNPKEKSYASLDLGQLMGAMGQMMGGEGAAGEAQDLSRSGGREAPRGGRRHAPRPPTKHFRWRTQYTMGMSLPMGMSMEIATDQTEDVWVADIAIDPKILRSFEQMGSRASLPENFQKIIEAAKKTQTGFPLKRVMVAKSQSKATGSGMMAKMMQKSADKQNAAGPQTTTFIVTELSEEKVPASAFAIPPGYTETELMAPGMMMPNMNPPD